MRHLLWIVFAGLALVVASPARAQDDPRKVRAEAPFQDALKLHDRGKNAEALAQFERAYAIYPSPNTRMNIAREEHVLGRKFDALRHYREALRSALLHPAMVPVAKKYIHELEGLVARVMVTGPEGLVFKLGDQEHVLPLTEPLDVEPGDLEASGRVGGTLYFWTRAVRAGESVRAELVAETPRAAPVVTPPSNDVRNIVTGSIAGAGLAGLATGVVLALSAESQISDAKRFSGSCAVRSSAACTRYDGMLQDIARTRDASTVSFVVGGGLMAISAAGFVLWPNAKVRPAIVGRGVGLAGEF